MFEDINIQKINELYGKFINILKPNYYNVKKYENNNIFYYKLDLLFTKFSGVLFSIFAILFLIKTEFKQIIKAIFNITIDPLEYTIYKYGYIFKIIVIITILLFISILFNS
jgi:magnesium-transporting ATPase (P-type)